MSVVTSAQQPSTVVTEIPGRFSPVYVVDKRGPATLIADSTTTSVQLDILPRAETLDATMNTPTNMIDELGVNFHVGEYDDLPESKATLSIYDTSYKAISLITGKATPSSGTATYGFNDLNVADVDLIRQFADPNGNIFASTFQGSMVIEEFGFSLKTKSVAMENYSLAGFNMMKFNGFIQTKAYIIVTGNLTAFSSGPDSGKYGFSFAPILGSSEEVVPIPIPVSNAPASYWIQNGCYNFLKVERWNSALGWVRYPEVATVGALVAGTCYYDTTSGNLLTTHADLAVGDVWLMTYCTYASNAVFSQYSNQPYTQIFQNDMDTASPIAIPTRLTPFTIAGNNIPRGQSLDVKMSLKRERAEGIGDVTGVWGPSAAPDVSVSLEVKKTDFGLNAILDTGSPEGTGNGGTVTGDFYDPNYAVRYQIANAVPLVATLYDPRDASQVVKTYTLPTIVLNSENESANTKNAITIKFSGNDRTGNLTIGTQRPY